MFLTTFKQTADYPVVQLMVSFRITAKQTFTKLNIWLVSYTNLLLSFA